MAALAFALASPTQAQTQTPDGLLQQVERNNPTLQAARQTADARALEARSANNLPNPSVGYDYLWGSSRAVGNSGELNVVQGFDFPTLYATRGKLARTLAAQYDSQYDALRQEVLLEAGQTYLDLLFLMRRGELYVDMEANARRLAEMYAKKVEAGDANVLERNKADIELANAHYKLHANEVEIEACMARLSNLNGGVMPEVSTPDGPGPLPGLPALEGLLERYRQGDPGLDALRRASDAAGRQVKVARGGSLPRFEVGYRRETAPGEHFDGVKMGMTVPLFEGRHTVKRARAEQHAAAVELRGGLSSMEVDLRRLHAQAGLLLKAYNDRLKVLSPERNAELLNKAIDAGQISVVDYFTEMLSIVQMQESALDFELQYRKAVAELLRIDL